MELKRILARDTRSATDKAIALYGPDVLVISNHQVDGQTELVVALDVQPEPPAVPAPAPAPKLDFRQTFAQAQKPTGTADVEPAQAACAPALEPVAAASPATEIQPQATTVLQEPTGPAPVRTPAQAASSAAADAPDLAEARDMQRSRELVDLVRGEIAALRREFRLSQQTSAWQSGLQLHPALTALAEALNDMQVPAALRALLLDALKDQSEPHEALAVWRAQLAHSLQRPPQPLPTRGLHVLAGPSGSGKTLMCARLAHHASGLHGAEGLALISYRDHRAGAWSQVQMLGAQLGIDCYRANDDASLALLVGELSARALVLIDTPGVQMNERLAEIQAIAPQAALHAVVPAEASSAALQRVLLDSALPWSSVMVSKLDESPSPWALLQLLSDNALALSCASGASRMTDLMSTFTPLQLIDLALAPLQARFAPPLGLAPAATPVLAGAPVPELSPAALAAPAEIQLQTPKPRAPRKPAVPKVKSTAPAAKAAAPQRVAPAAGRSVKSSAARASA